MSVTATRLFGFAVLGGFGLLHWMAMVEPAEPLRAAAALAVALLAAARPRLLIVTIPATLIAGGVDPADLWPGRWGELGASLGAGVEGVGGARIPYAGSDPDVRLAIALGGALLVTGAALLSMRSRAAGLVALGFLYGIPSVAVDFGAEFARGAALALFVLAYLHLERVRVDDLAPAIGLAAAGSVIALAAGPALDADRPWFDYESFARDRAGARTVSFDWNHDYGALYWSRDGREMIQVQSPRSTYWKVDTLDHFDGRRWRTDPTPGAPPLPAEQFAGITRANRERWSFPVAVSVRALRSQKLPLAAITRSVRMEGAEPDMTAVGVWSAGRELRRGDAYNAEVYVPQPSEAELAAAPADYDRSVFENLAFEVATPKGEREEQLLVWGFGLPPRADFYGPRHAVGLLRSSRLGRTWDLSRRLLRGGDSPYDYVRAVRDHLRRGFAYDETPPAEARSLEGFLFDARAGFCQHYSGAMALLLRMGGVPARVATGFTAGSYDERDDSYVVRDLDAHSWVEAWFAGIGWVVFEPTPAAAPPRSQALPGAITAGVGDIRDRGTTQGPAPAPAERDRGPLIVLTVVLLVAIAGTAAARRERSRPAHELERALRAAGEPLEPRTTLLELERRLGAGAAGYLRALRAQRYGEGPGPSAHERRGLRRALAEGRGPLARVRARIALVSRLH